MNHSFDVEHARLYGMAEAVLISNLEFWIAKNEANKRHHYKGRTWTYNSAKAFAELFPYMSDRQIRRTLDSLEEQGVLLKDNFNQSTYDRTLWYAFSDKWIAQKRQMHSPNLANGLTEIGESLTDSKTDIKQMDACPHQQIIQIFKEELPDARHPRGWPESRAELLRARWLEDETRQNLDYWRELFRFIGRSDFLMGRKNSPGRPPFVLALDWICKQSNFLKIIEGAYDNE